MRSESSLDQRIAFRVVPSIFLVRHAILEDAVASNRRPLRSGGSYGKGLRLGRQVSIDVHGPLREAEAFEMFERLLVHGFLSPWAEDWVAFRDVGVEEGKRFLVYGF